MLYIQVVPVKGYILLPQFEVSLSKVAFNTVLVGETSPSTFQLTNPSLSETLWTITQGTGAITVILDRRQSFTLIHLYSTFGSQSVVF